MSAPAECIPSTDEYEEDGNILKTIALSDPERYFVVDRGPCNCCPTEGCCGYATMPNNIYYTINGIYTGVLVKSCLGTPPFQCTWDNPSPPFPPNCSSDPNILTLACVSLNTVPPSYIWHINPSATTPGPNGNFIPDCCDPFYFVGTVNADPGCPGTTFDVCLTEELACPEENPCSSELKWWCVPTASFPFRDCVQGVTEAVNGPYETESECLADVNCLPADYYCVKIQVYTGLIPVGAPTFECQEHEDVTVGQVIIEGDTHTTILDGPFTEEYCECPPCAGGGVIIDAPVCDTPISGATAYACLDGVCVEVVPGTEGEYGPIFFNDPTCDGTCE